MCDNNLYYKLNLPRMSSQPHELSNICCDWFVSVFMQWIVTNWFTSITLRLPIYLVFLKYLFSYKWWKHSHGRGRRSLGHWDGSGWWMDPSSTDPSFEQWSDAGRICSLHLHWNHRNVFKPTSCMKKEKSWTSLKWLLWKNLQIKFFVFVRHKHFELISKPIFCS